MSALQQFAFAALAALAIGACGDDAPNATPAGSERLDEQTVERAGDAVSISATSAQAGAMTRLAEAHERLDQMKGRLADLERGSRTRAHDQLEAAGVELAEARDEFERAFDDASESAHAKWTELSPRFDDLIGEFDARYTSALAAARTN